MDAALFALIFIINLTPAILIIDEPVFPGFVCALTALSVIVIARTLQDGESEHLRRLFRPIAIVAAVPVAWMLIQALPLRNLGWAHPVWQSAATALGDSLVGSLSVDRGATLVALFHYLLAVAIMFVSAAVAINRQRAKWILLALTSATALIAIVVAIQDLGAIRLFSEISHTAVHEAAIDSIALGTILSAASAMRAIDPYERRQAAADGRGVLGFALVASLAAFAICILTLIFFGTTNALVATAFGLATLMAIVAMRRFDLGLWGGAGITIVIVAAAVAVVAVQPRVQTSDWTIAFASPAASDSVLSITQRMLSVGSWTGSGAGTFRALVPIYKDIDDVVTGTGAPTAAAAVAVEFGRPILWLAAFAAIAAMLLLLRAALSRGRDSFYPSAAASGLVTATLLAFSSAGMLNTSTSIIAATTIGLGFAQSRSRAVR